MTTPQSMPPRPSVGRSSFAIAMKDYTFIRPGVAVSISAVTLVAALIIGTMLIASLARTAQQITLGAQMVRTLHGYSAAFTVWRGMAAGELAVRTPEARKMRDSLRAALTAELQMVRPELADPLDQLLVTRVVEGLRAGVVRLGEPAEQAMATLLVRHDTALFEAAAAAQRAVLYAAILLALTVLAAGMLVVPMAWLYIRYKRAGGAMIEVKL